MTEDTYMALFEIFQEALSGLSDEELREFVKGAAMGPDDE